MLQITNPAFSIPAPMLPGFPWLRSRLRRVSTPFFSVHPAAAKSSTPVKYTYTFEPIVPSGKMRILKDDPIRLYYRLTEAPASSGNRNHALKS
ncbi:MAG: hypothetical protein JWQ21_174 [Herminiimonas sp.]|nr:hypothetical protein [Herminiimonas sp.]